MHRTGGHRTDQRRLINAPHMSWEIPIGRLDRLTAPVFVRTVTGPPAFGEHVRKEVPIPMTSIYLRVMELINRDEEGQGLAEYALILALIAIIAIVALIFLGGQVSKILSTVGASV